MRKSEDISILEYIRNSKKVSRDKIHELFGGEGVCVLDVYQARFSDARKLKDGRSISQKREDVINQMIEDINSGELKNSYRIYKRQELFMIIAIASVVIIGAFCILVFGGILLLIIPPIWIIILLLIWIIKKL